MIMFRAQDEELLTSISIRMSTIEFFDNCVLAHRGSVELVQQILEQIYSGQLPEGIVGTPEKFAAI